MERTLLGRYRALTGAAHRQRWADESQLEAPMKIGFLLAVVLATMLYAPGQTPSSVTGARAECPDRSGWDATTWPVLLTDDGKRFIRVLHIYADAQGES